MAAEHETTGAQGARRDPDVREHLGPEAAEWLRHVGAAPDLPALQRQMHRDAEAARRILAAA